MDERRWSGRTGGGHSGQQGLLLLFALFDVVAIYPLLFFIIPFYMVIHGKECSCIFMYMHKILKFNVFKSIVCTYWNHVLFGMMILDRFAVYAGQKKRFKIKIDGVEYYNSLNEGEKGFILASAHIGNFEITGYLLKSDRKTIHAVAFDGETADIKANRNKVLNANSIKIVPLKGDMSHLFTIMNALRNGDIVCMPCDRILGSKKHITTNFLGYPAKFPAGIYAISKSMEVPVLGIFTFKTSIKGYTVFVRQLRDNTPFEYVKEMERLVKSHPCQFFNYYDFWEMKA